MIVPFDRFADMLAIYRNGYARRGLDYAIWGHISDGNVHPNVIPRTLRRRRKPAARRSWNSDATRVRLGGCPLAEHGVGRSTLKQPLLRAALRRGGHRADARDEARARSGLETRSGSDLSGPKAKGLGPK